MALTARLAVLLVWLPLAACGTLVGAGDRYWLKDDAPRFPSPAESLVAYHAYAWKLAAADWARESERVHAAVARDPSLFQRLREAVLAAAPAAPPREHARAETLLEQCEGEAANGDAALKGVVVLLRDELAERRRLEQRLHEEARRADDADRKLRALKAIELNMLDRGRPSGGRKP